MSIEKLNQAWNVILDQYRSKAEETSKKEGSGISMFRMLLKQKSNGSNCDFYYVEKDGPVWKMIMEKSPDKLKIEKLYNPDETYLIMVAIPENDSMIDTIQNIRLFKFDSHEEIII